MRIHRVVERALAVERTCEYKKRVTIEVVAESAANMNPVRAIIDGARYESDSNVMCRCRDLNAKTQPFLPRQSNANIFRYVFRRYYLVLSHSNRRVRIRTR